MKRSILRQKNRISDTFKVAEPKGGCDPTKYRDETEDSYGAQQEHKSMPRTQNQ